MESRTKGLALVGAGLVALAGLTGTLLAWPALADDRAADPDSCVSCHRERFAGWSATIHAKAGGTCLSCHRAATLHQPDTRVTLYDSASCAGCHSHEAREWQASGHNRPVPYTPGEIAPELIADCVRCHNAAGFVAVIGSGQTFATARGKQEQAASPGVTCAACHDPHAAGGRALLRVGSPAKACDPCHGDKWQALAFIGTGGQRYPDTSYAGVSRSPHNTGERCVTCHMARPAADNAGGHTLRLRTPSSLPNIIPCLSCHAGIRDFNLRGRQEEVKGLLRSLEEMLKARNGGELPGFQPGKCNQCHRGGTQPFKDDPDGLLEQAFQNYRFILNDQSDGVHNPAYTVKLLRDSIKHIQEGYQGSRPAGADGGCCGH